MEVHDARQEWMHAKNGYTALCEINHDREVLPPWRLVSVTDFELGSINPVTQRIILWSEVAGYCRIEVARSKR